MCCSVILILSAILLKVCLLVKQFPFHRQVVYTLPGLKNGKTARWRGVVGNDPAEGGEQREQRQRINILHGCKRWGGGSRRNTILTGVLDLQSDVTVQGAGKRRAGKRRSGMHRSHRQKS